ncbi:MAG: hypothetical protein A2X13_13700 [Bacteroidetes bacterium GWC2_33_15]|nr:MAG: hypothetical protein A2X10_08915 [Bacteroidetes bacterium GWA2_33_15]OFX50402.1 MAG: hypothetical protein A2X13_13700 [Bacteroidetes bacterium GWC2_33_15]OFX66680.1 MAG: hypothetical protein A2X15_08175 [Bacteroidetes bacterium GWB2_32_14]OFX69298.1 MAG: hypothetical protein A2X14_09105 [Bacteroidetes bacterium GWD2_33_33]HAN18614.1 hypothetical protein [Bacteroidales bacterium]
MESLNNELIIEGIRSQNPYILNQIYTNYFPEIRKFIIDNNGTIQDAKDIFQEAIIIIYRKLKVENIVITKSFNLYLIGVCRYLWYRQVAFVKNESEQLNHFAEYERLPEFEIDEVEKNDKYKLYQFHFKQLGIDCQKILEMFLNNVPIKEIARKMGNTSENYIKSRKYKCKEQLVNNIKNDPRFAKYEKK